MLLFLFCGLVAARLPGLRSKTQIEVVEKAAREAAALSEAATSEAIALIDSVKPRLPACSHLSGAELLELYENEVRTVELVHNIYAEDLVLLDAYLPNSWELRYEERVACNSSEESAYLLNDAETNIYGFPSFSDGDCPGSFREAADRPVYTAFNSLRLDAGNPAFGTISLVLRQRPEAILIAPADTGSIEFTCNKTLNLSIHFGIEDCSLWGDVPVGTMKDHKHLLGAAVTFMNSTQWLVRQFKRFVPQCASPAVLTRNDLEQYWEAVYAMPVYWDDLKFLVGSFDDLFGTPEGAALVRFAQRRSKALVWARSSSETPGVLLNQRVLDPDTAFVTNATMDVSCTASKAATWLRAIELRKKSSSLLASRVAFRILYDSMRASLPSVANVKSLVAGACDDPSACFGLTTDNHTCVCYQ